MIDAQDEIKSTPGLKSGRIRVRVWPILFVLFAVASAAFVFWQAPAPTRTHLGTDLRPSSGAI